MNLLYDKTKKSKILEKVICWNRYFKNDRCIGCILTLIARIAAENRACFALRGKFKNKYDSYDFKTRIYGSIMRSIVEGWVFTNRVTRFRQWWQNKILRKVYRPVCNNNAKWQMRKKCRAVWKSRHCMDSKKCTVTLDRVCLTLPSE